VRSIAIDNDVYNREGGAWRDENNVLSLLVGLTPPRVHYMHDVVTGKLGLTPGRLRTLDVGCGGGLMAEEMARLGYRVSGVDPSAASIETARSHAGQTGLSIGYQVAPGESLPFADSSFDLVYCCDVLEHVGDLDRVIAETVRVLTPGGVYVYDTVNRTAASWLVAIVLFQEWEKTSIMPPNFHVWSQFITPREMRDVLRRHGLDSREIVGFPPTGSLLKLIGFLRRRKKGQMTFGELGVTLGRHVRIGGTKAGSYGGYAIRL